MKRTRLIATLVGLAAVAIVSQGAFARNRMYNPAVGRFMQRDPAISIPPANTSRGMTEPRYTHPDLPQDYRDGMNVYLYGRGTPIGTLDPTGRVVVIASGLWQDADNGSELGNKIAHSIIKNVAEYDGTRRPKVSIVLLGNGGLDEEKLLREEWRTYLERRRKNKCSLEQFVAVGHSDGATALFRTVNEGLFANKPQEPAYIGFADLLRFAKVM